MSKNQRDWLFAGLIVAGILLVALIIPAETDIPANLHTIIPVILIVIAALIVCASS